MKLVVDSAYVSFDEMVKTESVCVCEDAQFYEEFSQGHNFLMEHIRQGKPIYGVTTGYGASGKNYLSYEQSTILQENLYRFHGCGVGEPLSKEISKKMVLIRLISLAKGKSGVSFELLKRFELLYEKDIIPVIPSLGSVGASGDLTPLSYIASVIAGEREVWYEGEIKDVGEVYKKLGITPYVFKPKEALAVMNGTASMSAIGMQNLMIFERLLDSMESYVAGMFEVLLNDTTPLDDFVNESKPFAGQIESARNIKRKLQGSTLTHGRDDRYDKFFEDHDLIIQDTYSMRCAPQVLGVVRDNLQIAKKWVEQEINSVNDNPLIDGKNRLVYTSGNFYGGYVAHAMDTMKICVANVADLLDKEFALLVDHKFNRGLGENLKLKEEHFYHGFKAMQITLSSLSADVIKNTTAASIHSRPTESLNQDKVSMGTTASLDLQKMMEPLSLMLSIGFLALSQAVEIRGIGGVSPTLRRFHDAIRVHVPPLFEDRRMDGDIYKIREILLNGELA